MKKLLPFFFLLLFVTAKSQDQITLKFIRPSISKGVTEKILITIQNKEYFINDGSTLSVNVSTDYTTSLRIDCGVPQGPQTNYYLETKPGQTYNLELGLKMTGIYIKLLSDDDANNVQQAIQPGGNKEEWNTKKKVKIRVLVLIWRRPIKQRLFGMIG